MFEGDLDPRTGTRLANACWAALVFLPGFAFGVDVDEPGGVIVVPRGSSGCQTGRWFSSRFFFDAGTERGVSVLFRSIDLFGIDFTDPTNAPFEVVAGLSQDPLTNENVPPPGSVWVSIGHNGCGTGISGAPCYEFDEAFRDSFARPESIPITNGIWKQEMKGGPAPGTDHEYDTFDVYLEVRPDGVGRYLLVARMLRHKAGDPENAARSGTFQTLIPSPSIIGTPQIAFDHVRAFIGLRFSQCTGAIHTDNVLGYGTITVSGQGQEPELSLAVPAVVKAPGEPVPVTLQLTTDFDKISAIGARIAYDPALFRIADGQVVPGPDLPPSWSFVFKDVSVPGSVDVVVTDLTPAAATIPGPVAGLEVARLAFTRKGVHCTPGQFAFNPETPEGPAAAAFPLNFYVMYDDPVTHTVKLAEAITGPVAGPVMDDHGFIRGNVNSRSAHRLDLADVIDLAAMIFLGFPSFRCPAALDVNDDGRHDIQDVVSLLHGIFKPTDIRIAPPNAAQPGLGIPGAVVPDGGSIPSVLGCSVGETCP